MLLICCLEPYGYRLSMDRADYKLAVAIGMHGIVVRMSTTALTT